MLHSDGKLPDLEDIDKMTDVDDMHKLTLKALITQLRDDESSEMTARLLFEIIGYKTDGT